MAAFPFWMVIYLIVSVVRSHSIMTEPQSISPRDCRVGGEAKSGIDECYGPCDLRAIQGGYANFNSPSNPSATYYRGQRITVKYSRNNHGPGGFVRLTLVPLGSMMDKAVHERNAFHYSCWGANPQAAAPDELQSDRFGYSYVGNDGEEHPFARGYYVVNTTIPKVIPDGDYVFGWVWFGGIGSVPIRGNTPQRPEPNPLGYYADQWSCAYVRVRGGYPLEQYSHPVFVNDISQFNQQGCLAANDSPGVCVTEPCYKPGWFQKPRAFKGKSYPKHPQREEWLKITTGIRILLVDALNWKKAVILESHKRRAQDVFPMPKQFLNHSRV
ncbi:unnamed protein product [Agarophyton chilense]